MGRHKKPVEIKKLEGTYRSDRDGKAVVVSDIVAPTTDIKVPSEIKNKKCISAFKSHTSFLSSLGLLQEIDAGQLTNLYVILQEIYKIIETIEQMPCTDKSYESLINTYARLTTRFDSLAASYYISPAARTKLTSDMIQIQKGKEEVESIVARKLREKKA